MNIGDTVEVRYSGSGFDGYFIGELVAFSDTGVAIRGGGEYRTFPTHAIAYLSKAEDTTE